MRPFPVLIATAVLLVSACGEDGDPSPEDFALPPGSEPAVTLDSAEYTLAPTLDGHGVTLHATFTNRFAHPVFLRNCMPEDKLPIYDLNRTPGGASLLPFVWACVETRSMPAVWPGKSIDLPIEITGIPDAGHDITDFTGSFRLTLGLCTAGGTSDSCEPIPLDSRSSPPFTILPPP